MKKTSSLLSGSSLVHDVPRVRGSIAAVCLTLTVASIALISMMRNGSYQNTAQEVREELVQDRIDALGNGMVSSFSEEVPFDSDDGEDLNTQADPAAVPGAVAPPVAELPGAVEPPVAEVPVGEVPGAVDPAAEQPPVAIPDVDGSTSTGVTDTMGERHMLTKKCPECVKDLPPPGGYIMIMSSHSGSTAMMSQIVQHPGILWDMRNYEPLNSFEYEELNPWAAAAWAREYFTNRTNDAEGRIPGFKMSSVSVVKAPEEFKQLVKDFNLRIMWNYRQDALKRAIGRYPYYFLGDNTAIAGLKQGQDAEDRCSMGVGCSFEISSVRDLHCVMTRSWLVDDYMRKAVEILSENANGCYLELPYEEYLKYPGEQMNEAFEFLGLERLDVASKRGKATSDNMCEVASNYGDLCAAFAECEYWGWMMEDPDNNCSCKNYTYTSLGGDDTNEFCQVRRPEGYNRWCGGFNYEESVERLKELIQEKGDAGLEEYRQNVLGDGGRRTPSIME